MSWCATGALIAKKSLSLMENSPTSTFAVPSADTAQGFSKNGILERELTGNDLITLHREWVQMRREMRRKGYQVSNRRKHIE